MTSGLISVHTVLASGQMKVVAMMTSDQTRIEQYAFAIISPTLPFSWARKTRWWVSLLRMEFTWDKFLNLIRFSSTIIVRPTLAHAHVHLQTHTHQHTRTHNTLPHKMYTTRIPCWSNYFRMNSMAEYWASSVFVAVWYLSSVSWSQWSYTHSCGSESNSICAQRSV